MNRFQVFCDNITGKWVVADHGSLLGIVEVAVFDDMDRATDFGEILNDADEDERSMLIRVAALFRGLCRE